MTASSIVSSLAEQAVVTPPELMCAAAEFKGLKVGNLIDGNSSVKATERFGSVALEGKVVQALEAWGIRQYPHSKDMITFNDDGHQDPQSGYRPSNYWNFRTTDGVPRVTVAFRMYLKEKEGVVLRPSVFSESGVSACDILPNNRFFMAIRQFLDNPPAVVDEIKKEDDRILVSWADLGLANLKKVGALFSEFAQDREAIESLGWNGGIFSPPIRFVGVHETERFVPETRQAELLAGWKSQLDEYIKSITL